MNLVIKIEDLTPLQKERYNMIFHIFGKRSIKIISLLKGKGSRSWKSVFENIQEVNKPSTDVLKKYYTILDESIDLEENMYTSDQFEQLVSQARYECGLPAFGKGIKKKCREEMFKLFMWDAGTNLTDGKETLLGYKPIFRLKD